MLFFYFFLPGLLTLTITKLSIPYFKNYISAEPSSRGLHNSIKASGGGIIFAFVFCLFSLLIKDYSLVLISIPLSIIGLIDDKFNISSRFRLIAQIITVIFIIFYIQNYEINFLNSLIGTNFFIYFIILLVGVSIINFINFMDGIDGLVTGSFIVFFLVISLGSNNFITLVGALSGFLFFNWQPSKIFMGDAGSLFLGSMLVSTIFSSETLIESLKVIILITPLLADPLTTLIRRIFNRERFWSPHKLHLYQRLVSSGMSHSQVSLLYIFSIMLLGISYLFLDILYLIIFSLVVIFTGIVLDNKLTFD